MRTVVVLVLILVSAGLRSSENPIKFRHQRRKVHRTNDVLDLEVVVSPPTVRRRHPGPSDIPWPVKKEAVVEGDLVLGGLMMVHEREDSVTCGPIMPQGGVQAVEAMLYTLDVINKQNLIPNVRLGALILDDCDKDTYGLEMAVDFIKGEFTCVSV